MKEYLTFDDTQILPKYGEVESRKLCDTTGKVTNNISISFPVISSPMTTVTEQDMALGLYQYGGIGCLHRFNTIEESVNLYRQSETWSKSGVDAYPLENTVIASVGVTGDYYERVTELYNYGCRVICLDVAHGHHLLEKKAIIKLKENFKDLKIIGGNIATADAAKSLIEWGVDSLRVGIGGGSMCETRIRTGIGVPMVTCLLEVSQVAKQWDIPVIADGGIRNPGDVCKALACGADTVMLGSILAGTKESPGDIISVVHQWPYEEKFKRYSGSASMESKLERGESRHVEGNSTLVPYKGKMKRILDDISDGIKSSFSYTGSLTMEEFHRNAELIRITGAGAIEAKPHLLNK